MSASTWDEYQAIVRRPASILDSEKARELGYVVEAGPVRRTAQDAEAAATKGSEETLASVVGMRWRIVHADAWVEVER
jgi:hypothetical protein